MFLFCRRQRHRVILILEPVRTEMDFYEEKPRLCTLCCKAFTTQDALRVHNETQHPDEPNFEFLVCSEIKSEGENLKMNISEGVVPEIQPNEIPSTVVKTDEAAVGTEEENDLSDEKPFLCNFCHEGFSDSETIISHMMKHESEEGDSNDEKLNHTCHEIFTDEESLVSHKEQHGFPECEDTIMHGVVPDQEPDIRTGDKSLQCDQCDKAFARKDYLTKHFRLHSGEISFKCDYCIKAFAEKDGLTRHRRTHTGCCILDRLE